MFKKSDKKIKENDQESNAAFEEFFNQVLKKMQEHRQVRPHKKIQHLLLMTAQKVIKIVILLLPQQL